MLPHQLHEEMAFFRSGGGELVHAYTEIPPTGFCVELLERRNGCAGYGSATTFARLAAQPSGELGAPCPVP